MHELKGGNFIQRTHVRLFMLFCIFILTLFLPLESFAQSLTQAELGTGAYVESGLSTEPITIIVVRIIRAFFGLLGIVAVGVIVYAGFLWMTAGGDPGQVEKAKQWIINAVIGLAIMLSAFAIASFIIGALLKATTGAGGSGSGFGGGGVPPGFQGGGALGQAIEYVVPNPGASGVFRDTAMVVQFKEHVVPDSIFETYDDSDPLAITGALDISAVSIFNTEQGENFALQSAQVSGVLSQTTFPVGGGEKIRSLLTITLVPPNLLGSPQDDTDYTVVLSPSILKFNDAGDEVPLFASIFGYEWSFGVGTEVDLFPVKITSVYPSADTTDNFRNVSVLVNFDKAMMPSTILGGQFLTIRDNATGDIIDGAWRISNQARTAEFRTDLQCGESACGDAHYCFEPNIDVLVHGLPGNIDTDRGTPKAVVPFDGLVSLTGNSLDGDLDGEAEGQAILVVDEEGVETVDSRDEVDWIFGVGEDVDVVGPIIEHIAPNVQQQSVGSDAPIRIRFNEVLMPSSMSSVTLRQPTGLEQWYAPQATMLDANDQEIVDSSPVVKTAVALKHAPFLQSTPERVFTYMPSVRDGVVDAQGNCYVPASGPGCAYGEGDYMNPYCCNGQKEVAQVVNGETIVGYQCDDYYESLQ